MLNDAGFNEFLQNLSRVCPFQVEIRDAEGLRTPADGDGPPQRMAAEVRSLSLEVLRSARFCYAIPKNHGPIFGVPIKNGRGIAGSLVAYDAGLDPMGGGRVSDAAKASHTDMVASFLNSMAGLIEERLVSQAEVEKMAGELSDNFEEIYLYANIATQIKTLKFSSAMLQILLEQISDTLLADLSFVRLPDRPRYDTLRLSGTGLGNIADGGKMARDLIDAIPFAPSELAEKFYIVNDSRAINEFESLHPSPYRFLAVTIGQEEKFYGWLGMMSFDLKKIFRRSELRLLISIAEQIAVVIANTDLYRDLERFIINMVKSLVFAIEAKDAYTRGHSERVNRYSMLMADRLGLDPKQQRALNWASILHDIGKIAIPSDILNKPEGLTDAEFDVIKGHPLRGYKILKPLDQLSASLPGIRHHHERIDGRGYPDGLQGGEIPLIARIIAVADTFDAMTSNRAYRRAMAPEKALAVIREVAGTQLDAEIVAVFEQTFPPMTTMVEDQDHGS